MAVLIVYRKDLDSNRQQCIAFNPPDLPLIECGKVCEWLENPNYARICLGGSKIPSYQGPC
jgi:hypothetical protein